ncbi:MAG: ACT domain-containing protein [Spirochaetaceae bacterium]|nr:ACT domain-containing protein [Spirochaetaceae bacterium]
MPINQISVFLENKSGRLAEVTKVLAEAEINIRAMTIADTADFGILRIVVNNTDKACQAFEKNGFTVRITKVLGIEIEDKPGGLHKVMEIFKENGVSIEYLYASIEGNKHPVVIFKVEDIELGLQIAKRNSLVTVSDL